MHEVDERQQSQDDQQESNLQEVSRTDPPSYQESQHLTMSFEDEALNELYAG